MSFHAFELGSITDTSSTISSGDLRKAVDARGRELGTLGIQEGATLALQLGNQISFFINLLAAWERGACVLPLSPQLTIPERTSLLERSGAQALFSSQGWIPLKAVTVPPPPGSALLLYTSGSTGVPKGVVLGMAAVMKKLEVLRSVFSGNELERTLCLLPVSFGHGLLGNSLPALLSGGALHLGGAEELTPNLGELIDRKKITFFSSVPATWASTLPFSDPPTAGSLRRVFCASADLTRETWLDAHKWIGESVDFRHVYGITEAASWISALPAGESYYKMGAVGKGWGCEFRISGGEVQVKAPYLMSGYLGDAGATAQAFQDGFFRTGDLGVLDHEGRLTLTGRIKELINRGGMKVSPVEVETVLRRHPAVADCCVFPIPSELSGESVGAGVVLKGETPSHQELREYLRKELSEFKIPEKFYFLPEIPRNDRGKVNRLKMAELCGI